MKKILLLFALLLLTSMACQMPIRAAATPEPERILVSGEASAQLQEILATAVAHLQETGSVAVTITEVQLTSYLSEKLASQTDSPLQEPQIRLVDGLIEVTGKASAGPITANATILLEPVAVNGSLNIAIKEANFGSIPLPESTLNSLTDTINQNIGSLATLNNQSFYLDTIAIANHAVRSENWRYIRYANGTMTLSGRLQ